ncbi:MAG TPA: hypothetical protein VGF01_10075 [Terracidiphilus sp.]|jgi:hypothetical protein
MKATIFPEKGAQAKRKSDGIIGEVFNSNPRLDLITIRWRKGSGFEALVCTSERFFHDWELIKKETTAPRSYLALFILPVVLGMIISFLIESRLSTPSKSDDLAQGQDVSQSPEKFTECIENNDDSSKADSKLYKDCSAEALAWVRNCQKSGEGDERKCTDKSMDYMKMIRLEKAKMRRHMR